MCHICDTGSSADRRTMLVDEIAENGATALITDAAEPWVHTVGLTWNAEHPELVAIAPDASGARHVLAHLVGEVFEGRRFDRRSTIVVDGELVGFGEVHSHNLGAGWFRGWPELARGSGHPTRSLRALQVRRLDHDAECSPCARRDTALARRCTPDSFMRRMATHV